MALTPEEETIRNEILEASDAAEAVTQTEAITEPNAAPGTTRPKVRQWTSASVHTDKIYQQATSYVHPPSSPKWGAMSGITESVLDA